MAGLEDYARRFGSWFGGSGAKVGQVAPPPVSLGAEAVSPEGMDAYRRWRDEPGQGALEKLGAAFPQDTGLTGGTVAQVAPPPATLGPQQQAALEPFTNFGGTFGGEGAATADLAALGRAKGLEAAGHDAPAVWRETGWFKGPEDKWKHEIDDSYSFLEHPENAPKGYEKLQHPDVQDAYPDLWNSLQQSISTASRRSGQFIRDDNTLIARGPTEADRRSVALHELQHAIQGREGFAPGSSPTGAVIGDNRPDFMRIYRETVGRVTDPGTLEDFAAKAGYDSPAAAAADFAQHAKTLEGYRKRGLPDWLDKAAQETAQMEAYRLHGGEAEARAVQARADMTPEQRRATFPLDSYDVPVDRLIGLVRGGGRCDIRITYSAIARRWPESWLGGQTVASEKCWTPWPRAPRSCSRPGPTA